MILFEIHIFLMYTLARWWRIALFAFKVGSLECKYHMYSNSIEGKTHHYDQYNHVTTYFELDDKIDNFIAKLDTFWLDIPQISIDTAWTITFDYGVNFRNMLLLYCGIINSPRPPAGASNAKTVIEASLYEVIVKLSGSHRRKIRKVLNTPEFRHLTLTKCYDSYTSINRYLLEGMERYVL